MNNEEILHIDAYVNKDDTYEYMDTLLRYYYDRMKSNPNDKWAETVYYEVVDFIKKLLGDEYIEEFINDISSCDYR